jgi:predicted enzyme related to lactoylglutathione lyase
VSKEGTILRGISTINLWADDLTAATRWYTELLGVEPYFNSEAVGRGSGYVEFRIGDYQQELGILDRRFAPLELAAEPGGIVVYWHVDDVATTLERLVSLGAKQLEPVTERGPGFVTASVVDPFGNVIGIMYNRHYLDILGNRAGPQLSDPLRT